LVAIWQSQACIAALLVLPGAAPPGSSVSGSRRSASCAEPTI
jgi:hypothetical protein